jgi:hypothetical protein
MNPTKTTFFIIILLLILEFYFNYFIKKQKNKLEENYEEDEKETFENIEGSIEIEQFESVQSEEDVIQFKNPNPWCKISINKNDYTKYYIKMNNFDEKIFLEWKKLIDSLDYDVESKELILETKEEHEALALVNLIISNMNNNIDINEIIDKKLITISIQKAKSHKLVCNKLKELILENNKVPYEREYDSTIRYNSDINEDESKYENIEIELTKPINSIDNLEKVLSNSTNNQMNTPQPVENFLPIPYGGSEFSLI